MQNIPKQRILLFLGCAGTSFFPAGMNDQRKQRLGQILVSLLLLVILKSQGVENFLKNGINENETFFGFYNRLDIRWNQVIFRQSIDMYMVYGDGEHCQIAVILGNFIMQYIGIGNDDVSWFYFISFVVYHIIPRTASDKQKFQLIGMLVQNPGVLAEPYSNIAG